MKKLLVWLDDNFDIILYPLFFISCGFLLNFITISQLWRTLIHHCKGWDDFLEDDLKELGTCLVLSLIWDFTFGILILSNT